MGDHSEHSDKMSKCEERGKKYNRRNLWWNFCPAEDRRSWLKVWIYFKTKYTTISFFFIFFSFISEFLLFSLYIFVSMFYGVTESLGMYRTSTNSVICAGLLNCLMLIILCIIFFIWFCHFGILCPHSVWQHQAKSYKTDERAFCFHFN